MTEITINMEAANGLAIEVLKSEYKFIQSLIDKGNCEDYYGNILDSINYIFMEWYMSETEFEHWINVERHQ